MAITYAGSTDFANIINIHPRELLALIADVVTVEDGADNHLIKEFGAIKFEFGKDKL